MNSSNHREVNLYKSYHALHIQLEKMDVYAATQSLRQCIHLNEQVKNKSIGLKLELMSGTLYDIFGFTEEELIHRKKAQIKSLTRRKWQEYSMSNLASTYIALQDYSTAFAMLDEWHKSISDSTPREILKTNYFNLGQCYRQLNKLDSSMIYQLKSLELELADRDTSGLAGSYMEIGNVLYLQYLDDSAKVYFKKAYDLARKVQDFDLMQYTTLNMAVVEESTGNIRLALNYRKEYEGIKDSLDNRNRLWAIAKEEKEFAVGLKEQEIAIIEKEKAIKTAELQAKKRERNVYLLATVLLIIFLGAIGVLFRRSVSKKKIIEQQRLTLEALNSTKNRILSILAHDLKSPVYHIVLNNKSLLHHFEEKCDLNELKKMIESNTELGNRTYQLIDNLLNWALCQSDQLFFLAKEIPLKKTVEHVVYNFQPIFSKKDIQFEYHIAEETEVFMDLNSLKVVLRNLFDNAIKYTQAGGKIKVYSIDDDLDYLDLNIADTGVGMSSEKIENNINQKLNESTPDVSGNVGTGLGLNLCSNILEKNNCGMSIVSHQGEGTVVTLRLKKHGKN